MTRNLRTLGLALVAMLAMSAMAASAAHATKAGTFQASEYPATMDATGSEKGVYTAFGGEVRCAHAKLTSDLIAGPASELKVTPVYSNCSAVEILPGVPIARVTVTHNACKYRTYHPTLGTPSSHIWTLTVDVECPPGKQIEVHVYSELPSHSLGASACTITVGSQAGLQSLTVDVQTAPTPDDAIITGTVEGITAQSHGSACEGPETDITKAAIYHIPSAGVTAQATNENEEVIDGWIG